MDAASQFQQMANSQPDPKAQPNASAPATSAPATPAPQGDMSSQFQQMEQADKPVATTTGSAQHSANDDNSEAAKELASKQATANHGTLARVWDWVSNPALDTVLPEGHKTADVIKASAFEKMYNEAYIPGVNDFNTKAAKLFKPAEHMAAALNPNDKEAAIVKDTKKKIRDFLINHASSIDAAATAGNTFAAGSARDAADMAAGF